MDVHALLTASAVFIGVFVEFTFIATFMQCFFARSEADARHTHRQYPQAL